MDIIINSKKHWIVPLSKLKFNTFNDIMVKNEVCDLKEYISLFIDMPIKDLMSAEIKTTSMPALHAGLFDIDVKKQINDKPKVFKFGDNYHYVDEMTLSTFGQNYIFDLYFQKYEQKELNIYEISLYAISCHLTKSFDMSDVERIYKELCLMNWKDVLPTAFFLVKKFLKKKSGSIRLSIFCTVELSRIQLLLRYQTSKQRNSMQRLFRRLSVKSPNVT